MRLITAICVLIISIVTIQNVQSVAVMSVDFGSEWIKIGIVSPGVPMEIALNKESKRKTPAVISFRDGVRTFGEDAQTVGIRFPKNSYGYLLELLGKSIDHPLVKRYKETFPYYDIVEDKERGTILFKHDEETFYSPEELIAQLLVKAKEFAEQGAHQPIKECVLTVPGYFNQIERQSLLQAAQLANLKVLQLITDYAAVALNYGIFRSKDFNETAQYVMFYDMGASSTTVSIVSYQITKTKERGFVETHPTISVVGIGYDRTLGGLEMQLRLRDYLAKKFNEMKKTKNDVFKNPRALAKLFKEAGRLKNVLSANAAHNAQIEGLLDEIDFKLNVKREEFEELCTDLFARVGAPVDDALKTAHLTQDIITQVVLFGAGTRVPKIQEILQEKIGSTLAKNINTDEAAAMGAVYKAADLSTGFQVKKIIVKDAVTFPIQVVFERDNEGTIKQVKRTLFGLMNPYPQKKIITFNKHTTDFKFNVNYGDLEHLSADEITNIGALNLTEIQVTGIEEALKKTSGEKTDPKGIKAHFQMDESGVLNLINVEVQAEKTVLETEEEGTLSKLGSTISKLFGGEDKPVHEEPEGEATKDESQKEDEKLDEPKVNATNATSKNDTKAETKEKKPKIVIVKEQVKSESKPLSLELLNKEQLAAAQIKLAKLDAAEKQLTRRATALNNLESFVIDVQNKLYEDEYSNSATDEQKEKIPKLCQETSDWLYEEGSDADAETYEQKLETLKAETRDLFARVWEHKERPEALAALKQMVNQSELFLGSAKNLTETTNPDKDVFTEVEIKSLEKVIKDTKDWKVKAVEKQNKLKLNEAVHLTVKSITDKMGLLDREVKYLVNKLKIWRPKKVEKPKDEVKVEPVVEEPAAKVDEEKLENDTAEKKENEETIAPSDTESSGHTEL